MSSFRDTFTKDEHKEGTLAYDDSAFFFFAGAVLCCIVVPWTYSIIYSLIWPEHKVHDEQWPLYSEKGSKLKYCKSSTMVEKVDECKAEEKKWSKRFSKGFWIRAVVLCSLWYLLGLTAVHCMNSEVEVKSFDPFSILGIEVGATDAQIKKAYRKQSLVYHPDRNQGDPLANAKFIQISKAYQALTDEVAKANYEKYGNPDGPQTMKIGVGLPSFLLEQQNQVVVLIIFFLILLFVIPAGFIYYYQRQKLYAPNGVMVETLQFMGYYLTETTRVKNGPELLSCAAESRTMDSDLNDEAEMKPLVGAVQEPKKPQFDRPGVIRRNRILIEAHMQRLQDLMTPRLRAVTDTLIVRLVPVVQAMVEISAMREWLPTCMSMVELLRCLVQALDQRCNAMYQVPHFDGERARHATKNKPNTATAFKDFLNSDKTGKDRKGCADMNDQELADVEAFVQHVTRMSIETRVEVVDENEIVEGDIGTLVIKLNRENLQEGEAAGPVHAPYYPQAKFEEWWIFLLDGHSGRFLAMERYRSLEKEGEVKILFPIREAGKHQFMLQIMCDSYAGLDQRIPVEFTALKKDEVKREVIIHQEDVDIDLAPSLFQQMMGAEVDSDDEYESDDDDEDGKKPKPKVETPPSVSEQGD
ncbi:secretory subunit [Perkinsus olseni]|uniref:Secretory subunit n=3 Tax=Perkinsus olseni TaxID=32597 RepID=A0A7J6MXY8_PEROL|nr:secretory subunit [Perkinsus olseni]KAF4676433.1 secretory subunit [Perkinsus olseni]